MGSSRRKTDEDFERKLRERFEDFQAPDKSELSEKIFASITKKVRHTQSLSASFAIFLLLVGLLAGIHFHSPSNLIENKTTLNEKKTGISNATVGPEHSKISEKVFTEPPPTNRHKQKSKAQELRFVPKTETRKISVPFVAAALPDSSITPAPVDRKNISVALLAARNMYFRKLVVPNIIFSESSQTQEELPHSKSSAFTPVFSVTGLQQFQLINVHSDSEIPFQNIRFAPLLSGRSTGYKVSTGIQKEGLQLLLNYGSLRTWNYYELGTNRIEINPTNDNEYVQRRGGMPHIIDQKLHLLGLSARATLPLTRTPLRGLSTMAGMEFTTVLPERSVMFWANIKSVKSFQLGDNTNIAIGPYVEYSISQQSFLDGRWLSRPYRIGLTAEIKLP